MHLKSEMPAPLGRPSALRAGLTGKAKGSVVAGVEQRLH